MIACKPRSPSAAIAGKRVDEHLVRQFQQDVATAVGGGEHLVGFQKRGEPLVDADVGAGKISSGICCAASSAVELRDRRANQRRPC